MSKSNSVVTTTTGSRDASGKLPSSAWRKLNPEHPAGSDLAKLRATMIEARKAARAALSAYEQGLVKAMRDAKLIGADTRLAGDDDVNAAFEVQFGHRFGLTYAVTAVPAGAPKAKAAPKDAITLG